MLTINKKENFQKEKTGGRVDPPSPAGINRHPSPKFIHANLEKMGKRIADDDIEKILSGTQYPNIDLIASLSRSGDPRDFEDWVHYFMQKFDLKRAEAYRTAENLAVLYFDKQRFSSYESFKQTINDLYNKKKV